MTASSRWLIEPSFLALLDSGVDYRGHKVGTFIAGTNAEALAHVSQFPGFFSDIVLTKYGVPGPHRLPQYRHLFLRACK
jgi:hypothetical protein